MLNRVLVPLKLSRGAAELPLNPVPDCNKQPVSDCSRALQQQLLPNQHLAAAVRAVNGSVMPALKLLWGMNAQCALHRPELAVLVQLSARGAAGSA